MRGSRLNAAVTAAPKRTSKEAGAPKAQRSGPRSVTRLLHVLRVLAMSDECPSLAQLSLATRTPKTSLLALLRALVGAGYVVQRDAGYALGPEAFALGSTIVGQRKLAQLARPTLQQIAAESGETILLAELAADALHAVYIDKVESTRAIRFIANVGDRRPLYGSAGGRALLAFQSDEFRKSYIAKTKLEPLNRKKMLTRSELEVIVQDIRKSQLATTNEDVSEGVAGFSSPIFGQNGEVVAALVIGAPVLRGLDNAEAMSALVQNGAKAISRILGYVPRG